VARLRDDALMRAATVRLSIAAVAAISLLIGCGSSDPSTQSTANDAAQPTAAGAAPSDVPAVLDFAAPLVGGGEFSGKSVAGKPTAFWFWAPT
jgi:hypothetical protein